MIAMSMVAPEESARIRCERAMKALTEIATDLNSWGPFCHGTSSAYLKDIQENGLKPRQCTETGTCRPSTWGGAITSLKDRVYLGVRGSDLCRRAAMERKRIDGGEPVVLEISSEGLDKTQLTYDEDFKAPGYDVLGRFISEREEAEKGCKGDIERSGSMVYGMSFAECFERRYRPTYGRMWNPLWLPGEFHMDEDPKTVDLIKLYAFDTMKDIMWFCNDSNIKALNDRLTQTIQTDEGPIDLRWANSALGTGAIAYTGTIPPEHIRVVERWIDKFPKYVRWEKEEDVRAT